MPDINMTLAEVRDLVGGGEIVGDESFVCRSVASLERATANSLAFVRDRRYADQAAASQAGALVVGERLPGVDAHLLIVDAPDVAFAKVLEGIVAARRPRQGGVHPAAVVDPTAKLAAEVSVGAGSVISAGAELGEGVEIGANAFVGARVRIDAGSRIFPGAVLMDDTLVGRNVLVLPGAVIGGDGYGFIPSAEGNVAVPQVGRVVLGDDVQIGSLATVDRATIDETVVGRGTKLGDFAHVGHNCVVGEDVLILPLAAIGGSSRVGNRVIFAARAACVDNVEIGDGARIGAGSSVFENVAPGATVWGSPARDKVLEMRIQALLGKLPEMWRALRRLVKGS